MHAVSKKSGDKIRAWCGFEDEWSRFHRTLVDYGGGACPPHSPQRIQRLDWIHLPRRAVGCIHYWRGYSPLLGCLPTFWAGPMKKFGQTVTLHSSTTPTATARPFSLPVPLIHLFLHWVAPYFSIIPSLPFCSSLPLFVHLAIVVDT